MTDDAMVASRGARADFPRTRRRAQFFSCKADEAHRQIECARSTPFHRTHSCDRRRMHARASASTPAHLARSLLAHTRVLCLPSARSHDAHDTRTRCRPSEPSRWPSPSASACSRPRCSRRSTSQPRALPLDHALYLCSLLLLLASLEPTTCYSCVCRLCSCRARSAVCVCLCEASCVSCPARTPVPSAACRRAECALHALSRRHVFESISISRNLPHAPSRDHNGVTRLQRAPLRTTGPVVSPVVIGRR